LADRREEAADVVSVFGAAESDFAYDEVFGA
jgi:hypothetical protein